MKHLIIFLFFFCTSSTVLAAQTLHSKLYALSEYQNTDVEFSCSHKKDGASIFVAVDIEEEFLNETSFWRFSHYYPVVGLSCDYKQKKIFYTGSGGKQILCATYKTFLNSLWSIKSTGLCDHYLVKKEIPTASGVLIEVLWND